MRIPVLVSVLSALSMASLPVHAKPNPKASQLSEEDQRKAQSEALFQEGRALHAKKRDAEAIATFEKAYAIYPAPKILFNLALSEKSLGKNLAAIKHFRQAIRNPLLPARGIELGKKYISELETGLGRISVMGPTGVLVSIGEDSIRLPMGDPLDVEPGPVTVTGILEGQMYEGQGVAEAGNVVVITLKAPAVDPSPPPAPKAPQAEPPPATSRILPPVESEEENHTRHFVSGSLAALGVVGLGVGVGFTLAANKASSDVTKYSDMVGPESYTCEGIIGGDCGSLSKAAETRRKDTNVAKGSFVIGGTLLAAGVITYFVWPKSSKEVARIVPWVGKDVAGFSYGKEF